MDMTETNIANIFNRFSGKLSSILTVATVFLMVVILRAEGRIWWCKLGDYKPWTSEAWGAHTSQHFLDPYSFTHILHGVALFWIISLILKKQTFGWRLFLAIFVESTWEILENSSHVIKKYRENTASLDYFGDSIFNSVGDVFVCGVGFYIAEKLKLWWSLAFFFLVEIVLLIWIHDSLLLNIIMLIYPIKAIKDWQTGG